MTNTLDDTTRDAKFDAAQKATFERIFGKCPETTPNDVANDVRIDFKFGTGKSWMDEPRMTGNNDMAGIGEYNEKMHACNGYVEN